MRLGTWLDPRAEERLRRVSSSGGDEFVSRLTEGPVRTERDRPKADVEPLVLDDLVRYFGNSCRTSCIHRLKITNHL